MDYRKEREEFPYQISCASHLNTAGSSPTGRIHLKLHSSWCVVYHGAFRPPLTKRRSNERIYPMTSTNTFTTLQSQDHGCHLSKTKKNISWLFTTDHRLRNEGTINNDTKKHICHTRLIPTLYIWKYMFMHNIYIYIYAGSFSKCFYCRKTGI